MNLRFVKQNVDNLLKGNWFWVFCLFEIELKKRVESSRGIFLCGSKLFFYRSRFQNYFHLSLHRFKEKKELPPVQIGASSDDEYEENGRTIHRQNASEH